MPALRDIPHHVLTLSCPDKAGIVAAVSGFLAARGGFILESAQFGDGSTGRFFMRSAFTLAQETEMAEVRAAFLREVAEPFAMAWEWTLPHQRARVLLLVSKAGHCVQHLLYRQQSGTLPMEVVGVASNHPNLQEMVEGYGLPFYHLPVTPESKEAQEAELLALVEKEAVDLVVLARYMQILSPGLCAALRGKAINIHHSFLPGFKGADPYRQAYDRGVKLIGATAHYVTEDLDEGPIIEQEVIRVDHTQMPAALRAAGQDIECRVLTRAVAAHVQHRVLLNGEKTVVFG